MAQVIELNAHSERASAFREHISTYFELMGEPETVAERLAAVTYAAWESSYIATAVDAISGALEHLQPDSRTANALNMLHQVVMAAVQYGALRGYSLTRAQAAKAGGDANWYDAARGMCSDEDCVPDKQLHADLLDALVGLI